MIESLLTKVSDQTINIGVIGLGYVGLPLSVEFAKSGVNVVGFDVSEEKVALINAGTNYISDIPEDEFQQSFKSGRLSATTDFSRIPEMDSIHICVPTPLGKTRDPDMSFIVSVCDAMMPQLRTGQAIILESTTYPGTTEELLLPLIEAQGFKVGQDIYLAFSPERVDPGNARYQTKNTPKVLGGYSENCNTVCKAIYELAIDTIVCVSSTKAAEMVKLLENTFRAVNIGLVNEVAIMCDQLNVDVWEIVEAAATKPFGFMPFFPGPGLGGHCIPIDPHYLSWKMRTLDYDARFISLASEINSKMPDYVVSKVQSGLNQQKKSVNGSKILIVGVTYKADINDYRESPAIEVAKGLLELGADIHYHDDYVPSFDEIGPTLSSVALTPETLKNADAVVLITNHKYLDINAIVDNSVLVVDTRNLTKHRSDDHIVRL